MDIGFWADMMPHQITVEPFVSTDSYGAYTYGAATTHRARIQGRNRVVQDVRGEERVSKVTIYVSGVSVGAQDRITLPSPFQPSVPNILDIQHVSDEAGQHHVVIYA